MGAAQTGTGKTAAFSLPLLQRMLQARERVAPRRRAIRCARWCCCPRASWPTRSPSNVKALRQVHQPAQRGRVRRHRHEAADRRAQGRRRGAGRHAGPPARPHRGQERGAEPGRVRRARRGRPHARHRLPARPAAHPVSYLPKQRTDAAVLGHVLARDQAAGQQLPAGPGDDRGRAAQRDRHQRRTAFLQRAPTTTSGAPSRQILRQRGAHAGARVRQHQARLRAGLARSLERDGLRTIGAARRQDAGRAPEGAGRVQGAARSTCWWPPTSPRAASTSRTCRRCSTSTCRSTPRTTCTASAAPAAPARRAWR